MCGRYYRKADKQKIAGAFHAHAADDGTPSPPWDYNVASTTIQPTYIDKYDCVEQHFFPDIVAEVYFDQRTRFWSLRGRGVIPWRMELTDPNVKDDQIIAELSTYNIVCRARILR